MGIENCLKRNISRTIDGKKCSKEARVGYCWCKLHQGFLTAALLKEHKCIEQKCVYFQKYEDAQYWKEKEKTRQKRKEAQAKAKEKELKENFVNEIARSIVKDIDTLYIVGTQKDETRNTYITRYVATEFTPNVYLLQEKLCEMTKERCKLVCINANAETKREIIKKHPK